VDPYRLDCAALPHPCRVLGFRGEEALGRCFEYDVYFLLEEETAPELRQEGVIGADAALVFAGDPAGARIVGQVAEIELLEESPGALYRALVVPRLWFLRHSAHSRVFVGRSTPQIVQSVLAAAGIGAGSFELRLGATRHEARDHVCQYGESDLDFIQRRMEREGLYYFFDHAGGDSKLVICDRLDQPPSMREGAVQYHPRIGVDVPGEQLWTLRASHAVVPRRMIVADYNYMTPDHRVEAKAPSGDAPSSTSAADALVRSWGDNERAQAGAARTAQLRAEAEAVGKDRVFVEGAVYGIHAGFAFTVDHHPTPALNREYLAVRVVRKGQIGGHAARVAPFLGDLGSVIASVEAEATPAAAPFRPARRTARPVACGLELARVDGAASSPYAQIDGDGRYVVKAMMDEVGSPDGGASTRVRQLQPHGGAPEGWHLPLRKGTEVLLAFVGGDPDRPIIAGAIPNALTPSPVTKANHTQNVLQTGGRSRVEIEDRAGQQYIDISTPPEKTFLHLGAHAGLGDHNVVLSTGGDGAIHAGGTRDITIGGIQTEDVKGDLTETYHGDQTTHVAGALVETIDSGATQTIHSGFTQTVTGGATETIHGGETRSVTGGVTETIDGTRTQVIHGSSTESVGGAQSHTITGGATINSAGMYSVNAHGGITMSTSGPMTMMSSSWLMHAPGGQKTVDYMFWHVGGIDMNYYHIVFQPTVAALQAMAIQIGVYGARLDAFGRKFEFEAGLVKFCGAKRSSGILKKVSHALQARFGFFKFGP
jgi:type VI secretion system secreted protein VgrG